MTMRKNKKQLFKRMVCLAAVICLIVSCSVTFASAEEEKPELTNIALNKPVEATSSYHPPEGFFHEEYLVDGDWDTYPGKDGNVKLGWNTDTTGELLYEDSVVDIVIKLEGAYKVEKVVLKPMQWASGDAFPRDYTLQASPDGKSWTDIVSATDVNAHAESNTEVQPIVYEFDAVALRFFRIHITRQSAMIDQSGSCTSALGEVELWGYTCDPSELPETEPETYTITFVAGSQIVDRVTFVAGATSVQEPPVPEKEGYTGAWAPYTMKDVNFTVKAVYTAIELETETETEVLTEKVTETETDATIGAVTEPETEKVTEAKTDAVTEPVKDTATETDTASASGTSEGCSSVLGFGALSLITVAAAFVCGKKH